VGNTRLEIRIGKAPVPSRGFLLVAFPLLGKACAAAPAGTIDSVVGRSNGDGYPADSVGPMKGYHERHRPVRHKGRRWYSLFGW
jgi:hypothetical protein